MVLLLGMSYALLAHLSLLLILAYLSLCVPTAIYPSLKHSRCILVTLVIAAASYGYALYRLPLIPASKDPIEGRGIFHVEQIKESSSFFNRSLLYKGTLILFESVTGERYEKLPCHIFLPLNNSRPSAHCDYAITGTLCPKGNYHFVFKPIKKVPWTPLDSLMNLNEWRFKAKQSVHQYLKQKISHPSSSSLLFALLSGEVDEKILSLQFNKVGLQHLLTVSGFHFALISACLAALLRPFFPRRLYLILLMSALTFYYLFVGTSCAIQRAYLAILFVCIGNYFGWKISGLNALGLGLIIELMIEPLHLFDMGFQFSFLCTLAILLLYPLLNSWLQWLLPKRSEWELRHMPLLDQHGYLLCQLIRKGIALNLAVHLFSIPVILCIFHKFPCLSLVYNLFFPTCLSLSIILLFFALLIDPLIPAFSNGLFYLTDQWTTALMQITSHPPAALDFCIRTQRISPAILYLFLAAIFFISVATLHKQDRLNIRRSS